MNPAKDKTPLTDIKVRSDKEMGISLFPPLEPGGFSPRLLAFVFGFLMIASLVPIWIGKYFPSQNGPEYLLAVQMIKEYFNPAFNYSDYYDLSFLIIPNLLFHVIVYLLSFIFSILVSYKIVLSLNVILLPFSVFYFLKAIDSKRIILGFASFAFIYSYFIPKGYNSYYFSIPIFFFFLGYLVKHSERFCVKDLVWLSILGFLIYMSHVFSFLLVIFTATLYILLYHQSYRRLWKVLAVFIPSLVFFVPYMVSIANQSDSLVGEEEVESLQSWVQYQPLLERVKTFVKMSMYSFSDVVVFVFLIPLSLIAYLIIKKLLRLRQNFSVPEIADGRLGALIKQETMLCSFVILSVMFFALPYEIAGWPKFNLRLLPFVFIFMLASAEPFSKKVLNGMFLGIVSVTSVLLYLIMMLHIVAINKDLNDYTSGIPVIERNKTLLPVRLEDYQVGKIRPLHWAFNYYNLFKGGATGQSVVHYPGRVPMTYKQPIEQVFPSFDPNIHGEADMTRIKASYDYVLFWGKNEKIFNLFEKNGFKLRHEQGKLRLYSKL